MQAAKHPNQPARLRSLSDIDATAQATAMPAKIYAPNEDKGMSETPEVIKTRPEILVS